MLARHFAIVLDEGLALLLARSTGRAPSPRLTILLALLTTLHLDAATPYYFVITKTSKINYKTYMFLPNVCIVRPSSGAYLLNTHTHTNRYEELL